jgi:hypothetical protein
MVCWVQNKNGPIIYTFVLSLFLFFFFFSKLSPWSSRGQHHHHHDPSIGSTTWHETYHFISTHLFLGFINYLKPNWGFQFLQRIWREELQPSDGKIKRLRKFKVTWIRLLFEELLHFVGVKYINRYARLVAPSHAGRLQGATRWVPACCFARNNSNKAYISKRTHSLACLCIVMWKK